MAQLTSSSFVPVNGSINGQYYRHSGQVNVPGIVSALIVGLIAGVVMGAVYAAGIIFIPYIKLRFLLSIFYGIGLGAVPASLLMKFKVRNIPLSVGIAGVVTVASFYVSWVAWESILMRTAERPPSLVRLLTHPDVVYRIAVVADREGTWSVERGEPVNGNALLGIWAVEAICVLGGSLITARKMLDRLPFCEKCDRWCGLSKVVKQSETTDVKVLKAKMEAGDFAFAAGLPKPTSGSFLEFSLHKCGGCSDLNALTVTSRVIKKDKKGKTRVNKKTTVINKLLVRAGCGGHFGSERCGNGWAKCCGAGSGCAEDY